MAHRKILTERISQVVMTVAFFAILWVPQLSSRIDFDPMPAPEERREFADRPVLTLTAKSLRAFPSKYESFFNDHLGLRNTLISYHNHVKFTGFHVSPRKEVIVGNDGWLLLGYEDVISVYRGTYPYTDSWLDSWQDFLEAERDWHAKRGRRFALVIVPEVFSVYPEAYPAYLTRVNDDTAIDALVRHLEDKSDVDFLDLRPILHDAKRDFPDISLYMRHDSHWNRVGSFLGYQAIVEFLRQWYPDMHPKSLDDFEIQRIQGGEFEQANRLLALPYDILDELYYLKPLTKIRHETLGSSTEKQPFIQSGPREWMEVPDQRLPRLVMIHDSFGPWLRPHLAEHFSRSMFVWPAMGRLAQTSDFDELIRNEEPDLVIWCLVEREFVSINPDTAGRKDDLIANGSFERWEKGKPLYWDCRNLAKIEINRDTVDGEYVLVITPHSANWQGIAQRLMLSQASGGRVLVVQARVNASETGQVQMALRDYDEEKRTVRVRNKQAEGWEYLELRFEIPANPESHKIWLNIAVTPNTVGPCIVDSVSAILEN